MNIFGQCFYNQVLDNAYVLCFFCNDIGIQWTDCAHSLIDAILMALLANSKQISFSLGQRYVKKMLLHSSLQYANCI